MAERLGEAVLVLRTDDSRLDSGIADAHRKQRELGGAFETTSKQVSRSSDSMRGSLRDAGSQMGSFAAQVAGGQAALGDILMILPNVVGQLGNMERGSGNAGRGISLLAGLLSGALSGGIGIVIPIAVSLIERLIGIGDAASGSRGKVDTLTAALAKLGDAHYKLSKIDLGNLALDTRIKAGNVDTLRKRVAELEQTAQKTITNPHMGDAMGPALIVQASQIKRAKAELAAAESALDNARMAERASEIRMRNQQVAASIDARPTPAAATPRSSAPRASSSPRAVRPEKAYDPNTGIRSLDAKEIDLDKITRDTDRAMDGMMRRQLQINDAMRDYELGISAGMEAQRRYLDEATQIGSEFIDTVLDPRNWSDFGSMGKMVLRQLEQEMIRLMILNPIKNMLLGTNESTVKDVGGALGQIFSGFFAEGGMIAPGTFGIVGERGPEPVIGTSRGAMVLPNRTLREGVVGGGGGISAPVSISIDATGADPAGLARVQQQLTALERSLPGRIVTTVQDARSRRIV